MKSQISKHQSWALSSSIISHSVSDPLPGLLEVATHSSSSPDALAGVPNLFPIQMWADWDPESWQNLNQNRPAQNPLSKLLHYHGGNARIARLLHSCGWLPLVSRLANVEGALHCLWRVSDCVLLPE